MDALKRLIIVSIKPTSEEVEYILSHFKSVELSKDDYFVKEGKRCDEIAFVNTGMLRIFYLNDKGDETTCYFASPNEFITSYTSFNTQRLSHENIQAILSSQIFTIHRDDLEKLYQEIPSLQTLGRQAAENLTVIMEKRISMLQIHSADERYLYLMEHQPLLLQTVPLQYLASFLGITPQHLSRLRRKL